MHDEGLNRQPVSRHTGRQKPGGPGRPRQARLDRPGCEPVAQVDKLAPRVVVEVARRQRLFSYNLRAFLLYVFVICSVFCLNK